jgi:hypothetical protein
LQITASGRGQAGDLRAVSSREICVELVEVGIGDRVDRVATAAEVQHRRRRNRHLGQARRSLGEELIVAALDVARMADRLSDLHYRWCVAELLAAMLVEMYLGTAGFFDTVELKQEVGVEIGAPEFSVGDSLQAEILLERDHATDRGILDSAKRVRIDPLRSEIATGCKQCRRTQETADVVGTEGWHARQFFSPGLTFLYVTRTIFLS